MNEDIINDYIKMFNSEVYLNKKEVMYRIKSPLTIEEFWPVLLKARKANSFKTLILDQKNNNFWFVSNDTIKEKLEIIDKDAEKNFFEKLDRNIQKSVTFNAIIDEAFNSSVIEGAFSTKKRTREMIEHNIAPKNKSEKMIINNFKAMEYILENLNKPLDEKMVLSIYNIVTLNTLNEGDIVEKYRNDAVHVWDLNHQKAIYIAPPHTQVQSLMDSLIEFINNDDGIHPIIKSCIIHFYFVYIHPFFDGNGRTARVVSYMYLLKKGYNFFKFFSMSSVVNEEKNKYYRAIKDTEDYDSDLTYFIYFYTGMILNSINKIKRDFKKEYARRIIELYLKITGIILSDRQKKAVNFYIKTEKSFMDVETYLKKFNIVYETARSDLNQMVDMGLFNKSKQGKKYIYKLVDIIELVN